MTTTQPSGAISFLKIYGIIMAVDLFTYFLIFYAGRAIPPASPFTSYPGNYGLCLAWLIAHFPGGLILFSREILTESLLWVLILQDAWVAALIFLWKRRRLNDA